MRRVAVSVALAAIVGVCASAATSTNPKLEHLVVLMLENRAFDHMVGLNKQRDPRIDGCLPTDPKCFNTPSPGTPNSPKTFVSGDAVYVQPSDPSHSIQSTSEQMYGNDSGRPYTDAGHPSMDGFIVNYAKFNDPTKGGGEFIMKCFSPEHLPVTATLIEEFGLFNDWHAAIPGPTMVNRAYADSATSHGMGDNKVLDILEGYPQRTVFADLDAAGVSWRNYFELIPASWQFKDTRKDILSNYRLYTKDKFAADVAKGDMATYTFIDPSYYGIGDLLPARDQHPNHDVSKGEELIKEVYEALRSGPKWNTTGLLVTYDEHGGFFDHVPPPPTVNPDGLADSDTGFNFTRLGLRVPAIFASPWTSRGSIFQSNSSTQHFEHSSIPRTIHKLFTPGAAPLTRRESFASAFDDTVLNSPSLRTDCPKTLPPVASHADLTPLPPHGEAPLTGLQYELAAAAAGAAGLSSVDEAMRIVLERDLGEWVAERVASVMGEHPFRGATAATTQLE